MELNKKIEIARQNFRKYMFEYRQSKREVEQDHLVVSVDRLGFSVEKFQSYVSSKYSQQDNEIKTLNIIISRDSNIGEYVDSFDIYMDARQIANTKNTIAEITKKDEEFKELFDEISYNVWSLEKINHNDLPSKFTPTTDFNFDLLKRGVIDDLSALFLEGNLLIKLNQAKLELTLDKKNMLSKKHKI